MRTGALLVLAVLLNFFFTEDANAVCMSPDLTSSGWSWPLKDEYSKAGFVILGTPRAATNVADPEDPEGFLGTTYKIEVTKTFKGTPGKELTIFSENTSARFPLDLKKSYVLFVQKNSEGLYSSNCGNSGLEAEKSDVIKGIKAMQSHVDKDGQ